MNRSTLVTRSRISGSTFHTTEDYELLGRVIAEKRRRRNNLDPSLWPTERERPSFWTFLRRKM